MADRNQPATKGDLEDLEQRLRVDADRLRDELIEVVRDMQTEVLRAFHNWASPTEIKMRGHEERLTLMEERLRQIESKLNMN